MCCDLGLHPNQEIGTIVNSEPDISNQFMVFISSSDKLNTCQHVINGDILYISVEQWMVTISYLKVCTDTLLLLFDTFYIQLYVTPYQAAHHACYDLVFVPMIINTHYPSI